MQRYELFLKPNLAKRLFLQISWFFFAKFENSFYLCIYLLYIKMETNLVFFNSRDQLLRIDIEKIVYFEADGNYTDIIMVNKLRAAVCMNLGDMEKALAAQIGDEAKRFMRIGKRFIINMRYVYQINVLKQQLVLSDYDHFAFQVTISKDALRKMKDLMLLTKA